MSLSQRERGSDPKELLQEEQAGPEEEGRPSKSLSKIPSVLYLLRVLYLPPSFPKGCRSLHLTGPRECDQKGYTSANEVIKLLLGPYYLHGPVITTVGTINPLVVESMTLALGRLRQGIIDF